MEYQIQAQQMSSQLTAVVRRRAKGSELSTVVPQACGEVWEGLRAAQFKHAGRHVALYLDCEMNIEIGVEVSQPFPGNDHIVASCTPAGLVATTAHIGPYNRLGDAYDALHRWVKANGYTLAGPSWEVYGHWEDDPAKLRTDLYLLLQPPTDTAPAPGNESTTPVGNPGPGWRGHAVVDDPPSPGAAACGLAL